MLGCSPSTSGWQLGTEADEFTKQSLEVASIRLTGDDATTPIVGDLRIECGGQTLSMRLSTYFNRPKDGTLPPAAFKQNPVDLRVDDATFDGSNPQHIAAAAQLSFIQKLQSLLGNSEGANSEPEYNNVLHLTWNDVMLMLAATGNADMAAAQKTKDWRFKEVAIRVHALDPTDNATTDAIFRAPLDADPVQQVAAKCGWKPGGTQPAPAPEPMPAPASISDPSIPAETPEGSSPEANATAESLSDNGAAQNEPSEQLQNNAPEQTPAGSPQLY